MVHELLTALGVVFLTINVLYSILLFIYTRDLSRNYSNAMEFRRDNKRREEEISRWEP